MATDLFICQQQIGPLDSIDTEFTYAALDSADRFFPSYILYSAEDLSFLNDLLNTFLMR